MSQAVAAAGAAAVVADLDLQLVGRVADDHLRLRAPDTGLRTVVAPLQRWIGVLLRR